MGLIDVEMYIEQEKMGQKSRGFFCTYGLNRGAVETVAKASNGQRGPYAPLASLMYAIQLVLQCVGSGIVGDDDHYQGGREGIKGVFRAGRSSDAAKKVSTVMVSDTLCPAVHILGT